jgi:uncharacterized membrane protein
MDNNQQESLEEKFQAMNNTADTTNEHNPQDIEQNKVMAILAYLGILVLIPLFAAKESKFARFHTNQGLIICICGIILYFIFRVLLAISWKLAAVLGIFMWIVEVGILILAIIGIINAAKGSAKELPLIGKYRILK